MSIKRNYEQKKALVNKWFTEEELKEFSELSKKPVLAKVHSHSSSSLSPVIESCLTEIADEQENMVEAITECVSMTIDNDALMSILDMFHSKLVEDLTTEDGSVDDIELPAEVVKGILSRAYATFELIKTLTEIITSYDRVKLFKRRIELAKAGVSE